MPSLGDLPDPVIELGSPAMQVDSLLTELSGKPIDHRGTNIYLPLLSTSHKFSPILTRKLQGGSLFPFYLWVNRGSGRLSICSGYNTRSVSVQNLSSFHYRGCTCCLGIPGGVSGKETACQCRRHKGLEFDLWVGKIPWGRKWQPTPVFLPGDAHGQMSLLGYYS